MIETYRVARVTLEPGHYILTVEDADAATHTFGIGGGGVVTCDGTQVTAGGLFDWLAQGAGVRVTLHPDPLRYGLSMRTEFARDEEPKP